ncbi:hypothetical protein WA158_008184 [Blastocystis sp. Blastoise]
MGKTEGRRPAALGKHMRQVMMPPKASTINKKGSLPPPKASLSEKVKNLPFMVKRSDEQKKIDEENVLKQKMESTRWYYYKIDNDDSKKLSTPVPEKIYRYQFKNFNNVLERLLTEREQFQKGQYKEEDILAEMKGGSVLKRYKTLEGAKRAAKNKQH